MRHLVWHWGRRGAGPVFAARLAAALSELDGLEASLSLAAGAEILAEPDAPDCAWREPTYETGLGYAARRLAGPLIRRRVRTRLAALAPDMAICAMPSLLDRNMAAALTARGTGYAVIVHDADAHPGDALRFRLLDQERILHGALHLFCLSGHVEDGLRRRGFGANGQGLTRLWHPPLGFDAPVPVPARAGKPRLLHFGRLLPYKGLDLLANALEILGPELPFELRVCGEGPESVALSRLRQMKGVRVEARWIAEAELPELLAWSDALVLPYREASQSGVAAMGLAAGRQVLATAVGGLPEQLAGVKGAFLCAPNAPSIASALLELTEVLRAPGRVLVDVPDWRQSWRDIAAAMLYAMHGWEAAHPPAHAHAGTHGHAAWRPLPEAS